MPESRERPVWRRVALRALAWLVVGTVVSVGVAWGLELWEDMPVCLPDGAYTTDYPVFATHDEYGDADHLLQLADAAHVAAEQWGSFEPGGPFPTRRYFYHFSGAGVDERTLCVSYSPAIGPDWQYSREYRRRSGGWPARCLECTGMCAGSYRRPMDVAPPAACVPVRPVWHGGVFAPRLLRPRSDHWITAGATTPRPIPLRPRWVGLTVDAGFYGAALWLLFAFPFVLRRVVRKRRGRCTACGYSLAGLAGAVCPECGREKPRPGALLR